MALARGLVLGGLVLATLALFMQWKTNKVSSQFFLEQVLKLLRSGQRHRAERLCNFFGSAPVPSLVRYALELRLPRLDPRAALPGEYRSPIAGRSLEQRAAELLAQRANEVMKPVARLAWVPWVGAGLSVAGLVVGFDGFPLPVRVGLPLMVVLLVGRSWRQRNYIRSSLQHAREWLLPWVLSDQDGD